MTVFVFLNLRVKHLYFSDFFTSFYVFSIESSDQTTPSSDLNQNTPHENLPAKDGADGNNTKLQIGAKSDLKDLEESSLSLNPLLSLPKSLSQVNQVPDLIQFNNKVQSSIYLTT